MNIDPDDPRLTAYVLGELAPGEAAELEVAVLADPALRAAVAELRELQESLVFELIVEQELELDIKRRKEVLVDGRAEFSKIKEKEKAAREKAAEEGQLSDEEMVEGILEAISEIDEQENEENKEERGSRSFRLRGKVVPLRTALICSGMAACLAVLGSFLAIQINNGGVAFFRDDDPVDRWSPEMFSDSDVDGFNEEGGGAFARIPLTPERFVQENDQGDQGGAFAESSSSTVEEPNFLQPSDLVPEISSDAVLTGAGYDVRAEFSLPRGNKNPLDLGSRTVDQIPEPPAEFVEQQVEGLDRLDGLDGGALTFDMPYRWVSEFSKSEIPSAVDTASYVNVRRYLRESILPPRDVVHVEEMLNFFDYDSEPSGDGIFDIEIENAECPWNAQHQLVRIAVHARAPDANLPVPRNYIFLINTAASMRTPSKLGMLSESASQLVKTLGRRDKITIFTYDGAGARIVAGPLGGDRVHEISKAFANLDQSSGISGTPIKIAYRAARNSLIASGDNRVVLITDGDVFAGAHDSKRFVELAKLGNEYGINLSVAGVGGGVLGDDLLAALETSAGARSVYLEGSGDAARFFGRVLGKPSTPIARRVAMEVDFNSEAVRSYRLLGYARRSIQESARLASSEQNVEDGYALTALYEVIPASAPVEDVEIGTFGSRVEMEFERFQARTAQLEMEDEEVRLLGLRLRYDAVGEKLPKMIATYVSNEVKPFGETSADFQFAAAVAGFGLILRESEYGGDVNCELVRELAEGGLSYDPYGLRREFVDVVRAASRILEGHH